jgi:hypothetical protein
MCVYNYAWQALAFAAQDQKRRNKRHDYRCFLPVWFSARYCKRFSRKVMRTYEDKVKLYRTKRLREGILTTGMEKLQALHRRAKFENDGKVHVMYFDTTEHSMFIALQNSDVWIYDPNGMHSNNNNIRAVLARYGIASRVPQLYWDTSIQAIYGEPLCALYTSFVVCMLSDFCKQAQEADETPFLWEFWDQMHWDSESDVPRDIKQKMLRWMLSLVSMSNKMMFKHRTRMPEQLWKCPRTFTNVDRDSDVMTDQDVEVFRKHVRAFNR